MKKISMMLLIFVFILTSTLSVSAYDPLPPEEQVRYLFGEYYASLLNGEKSAETECIEITNYKNSSQGVSYYVIHFVSIDAQEVPCFSTFGNCNEYYQNSDVTNKIYSSGIVVFRGNPYSEDDINNFYSLEEIYIIEPEIIDSVSYYIGTDYVGRIGDVDGDGEITVMDATGIQMHLAKVGLLNNERVADVDNDGSTGIMDATAIQMKLAKVSDEAKT